VLDRDYPANLRTVHNRPPFLFARGQLDAEADASAVAVVGTRRATAEGLRTARRIATDLVEAGYTVASGLADGVDGAAHTAALEAGGRTVAVVGTGLRLCYPPKHEALQQRVAQSGAVLSQFWPDAPPTKQSFPMRNVVMSGYSLATVVVEASSTSGAKMQATRALDHGRPVFLLARLLEHDWAREYADLPGTYVVRTAREILAHLERLYSLDLAPA
jgi:DNA processing protein